MITLARYIKFSVEILWILIIVLTEFILETAPHFRMILVSENIIKYFQKVPDLQ